LHNKSNVSEDTKKMILEFIQEEKYTSNGIARSLVLKRTKTLGVVLPCITHSFFPKVTRAIEDKANEEGYHVILCHNNGSYEKEEREIENLREKRVDGMIITVPIDRDTPDIYIDLQKRRIPFVLLDSCIEGFDCDFVGSDDVAGAFEAIEHLIKLGHRGIAYVGGHPNSSPHRNRLKGYRKALEEYGIGFDPQMVFEGGFEEEDGTRLSEEVLQSKKKPTAIFAVDDPVAIGVYFALKDKGVRIPEDMALVGYAGINEGRYLEVPLTTVVQPVKEIGKTAAEMLIEMIQNKNNNGRNHMPRKVFLKPELIVRKSCGACVVSNERGDEIMSKMGE
ncbi:LacI family DNA-binding transcriptional regulator, partial [Candidatus Peregrinibacteria bacterium]|nr:LacI family DNA-binding transcriptional regulator [Candidatus Peregrinibacteria bacterium]